MSKEYIRVKIDMVVLKEDWDFAVAQKEVFVDKPNMVSNSIDDYGNLAFYFDGEVKEGVLKQCVDK